VFCCEELLVMRINYSKSELFTTGMDEVENNVVAGAFNCKLG
jgi:hypothetical protein